MAEAQGDQAEGRGEEVAASADPVAATLEYLARNLVEHLDDVRVERAQDDRGHVYRLHVHPDDVGRVIGRNGRMARSIRQVARAAAARAGTHAFIEIGD